MATKRWYFSGYFGSGPLAWLSVTESVGSNATDTTGWVVGTGLTNHSEMEALTERASTTFTGTTVPDGTIDTTLKDAFRTEIAYTGTFASGNWTFQFGVISTVQAGAADGRIRFRLIKADADGSNATEITSGQQQASLCTNVAGTEVLSTLTFNPGAITLVNQYLFIQVAWERTGAGGMTTTNIRLRKSSAAANGTTILSSDFTPATQAVTTNAIASTLAINAAAVLYAVSLGTIATALVVSAPPTVVVSTPSQAITTGTIGGGDIAFEGSSSASASIAPSVTFAHTHVGDLLIVGTTRSDDGTGFGSVTYNGIALTEIGTIGGVIGLYYLFNPPAGAHNVVVPILGGGNANRVMGMAASYSGAKQSGMPDAYATHGDGHNVGASPHVNTLTTVADKCWSVFVAADYYDPDPSGAPTPYAGTTLREVVFSLYLSMFGDSNGPTTPPGSDSLGYSRPGLSTHGSIMASFAPRAGGTTLYSPAVLNTTQFITASTIGSGGAGPLLTGLISSWEFEEISGPRYDSHGINHFADHSVGSATGLVGTAADFERDSTSYLYQFSNSELQLGDIDFTYCLWVNIESKPGSQTFLSKGSTSNGEVFIVLQSDIFQFVVFGGAGFASEGRLQATTFGSPSIGAWHCLVCWHDSVANTLNIQINNGAVQSLSYSIGVYAGNEYLYIGTGYPFPGENTDGLIDQGFFWKRVLTSDERTQVYNGGAGLAYANLATSGGATLFGPTVAVVAGPGLQTITAGTIGSDLLTGLVSYWNLNEVFATHNDSHGTNHLPETGFVGTFTGKIGNAVYFDPSNPGYASIADNASISTGNIDFTFGLWVRVESAGAGSRTILAKLSGTTGEYWIYFYGDSFWFDVYGGASFASLGRVEAPISAPVFSTWKFLVIWHDSVANTINVQIDNNVISTVAHSAGVYDSAEIFYLGSAQSGLYQLHGMVDLLGFWKKVLTPIERTQLYNGGAGRAYNTLSVSGTAVVTAPERVDYAVDQVLRLPIICASGGSTTYSGALGGSYPGAYALSVLDPPIGLAQTFAPTVTRVAAVDQAVTAGTITTGNQRFAPTVIPQSVAISESTIPSSVVLYAPTVLPQPVTVTAGTISSASVARAPTTVVPQAVTVVGGTITTGSQVSALTVSPQSVTSVGSTISAGSSVTAPITVAPQAVTVVGGTIAAASVARAPITIAPGPVSVLAATLAATLLAFAPTVVPGSVTVIGGTRATTSQVFAPVLTPFVSGATIVSGSGTFPPSVTQNVTTGTRPTTLNLFAPTLAPGPVSITLGTRSTAIAVNAPAIAVGPVTVVGATIITTAQVFAPALIQNVVTGTRASTAALFAPTLIGTVVTSAWSTSTQLYPPVVLTAGALGGPTAIPTLQMFGLTVTTGPITIVGPTRVSALNCNPPSVTTLTFVTGAHRSTTFQIFAPTVIRTQFVTTGFVGATSQTFTPGIIGTGAVVTGTVSTTAQMYAPSVTVFLSGATIGSTAQVFAPKCSAAVLLSFITPVSQALTPSVSTQTFVIGAFRAASSQLFAPSLTTLSGISTGTIGPTAQVFAPSLPALIPGFITSTIALYGPAVEVEIGQIIVGGVGPGTQVYPPTVARVFPPTTCVASQIVVRYLVTTEGVACMIGATAGIQVRYLSVGSIITPAAVVTSGITVRTRVTSSGVCACCGEHV